MPLTPEEVAEAKRQLSDQINHLPPDQKAEAQKQIDAMSPEAIETMIAQQQSSQQPIFRMIVECKIPSKKIGEVEDAIAVLSTKAISKGHTVIIPKKEVKKAFMMPASAFALAKAVSAKIVEALGAEGTEIQSQFLFGEMIIHVIPVYDKPVNINSQTTDASEKELEELADKLFIPQTKETKVIKQEAPKETKKVIKLKRKVP